LPKLFTRKTTKSVVSHTLGVFAQTFMTGQEIALL